MLYYDLAPEVDVSVLLKDERRRSGPVQKVSPASLSLSDYGPTIDLLSTHEDVVAAYGEVLTERALRSCDGAGEEEERRKRRREEEGTARDASKKTPISVSAIAAELSAPPQVPAGPFKPYGSVQGAVDYQGRSFLHVPGHLATEYRGKARLPSRPMFVVKNSIPTQNDAVSVLGGVQCLQWMPPVGHLLFSADLSGRARLWDMTSPQHAQVAEYVGHTMPVRSLEVSRGATSPRVSTASVDGAIRQWDIETAALTETLRHASGKPCLTHRYHPFNMLTAEEGSGGDSRLIVAAVGDKIVLWDVRASCDKPQREYSGHTGAILHIAFLDGGRKMLTTSEDKTMRTWEFRVPVQIKQFADAGMHALSHVQAHPTEEYLAAQSFDDTIVVIRDEGGGKVKFIRDKVFSGHMIAGSACQLQFSPDGQLLSSGDVNGAIHIWRWSTGERLRTFAAHAPSKPLVSHLWHPTEPNRMVTSSWDGTIRMWG